VIPAPSKEVTMSSPAPHPAWCDPARCEIGPEQPAATHCSRLVVLGPYPPGTVVAEVSAVQGPSIPGYPWSGRPFIALGLRDQESELCLAPMSVELAGALGRVLTDLATEVGR
jgi:hypothetical protein